VIGRREARRGVAELVPAATGLPAALQVTDAQVASLATAQAASRVAGEALARLVTGRAAVRLPNAELARALVDQAATPVVTGQAMRPGGPGATTRIGLRLVVAPPGERLTIEAVTSRADGVA
jgi:hypothetical protein